MTPSFLKKRYEMKLKGKGVKSVKKDTALYKQVLAFSSP